jgi:hypothetical protein
MKKKTEYSLTLAFILFLISIATIAWGGPEKDARRMYNQALLLLGEHEPFKAEKLLKDIVSNHMDSSVATEAIRTLQMMKSFRIIEEYGNAEAQVNLLTLVTAMNDYYKDHKEYGTLMNELEEKYGFRIFDKGTTVTIVFADEKNYIVRASHERGDKIYLVKGPTIPGSGAIRVIDKDISGVPDDEGNKRISFQDLEGSWYPQKMPTIFVVKGMVTNNYPGIRSFIKIRSNILDSRGNVVRSKTAYAGNLLSDEELRSLSMKEIDDRLRNKPGKNKANVNILPFSSVPFMVIFDELPKGVSEFTVEAVSSSPAGKEQPQ